MNTIALKDLIKTVEKLGAEADKVNIATLPFDDISKIVQYNRAVNELVNILAGKLMKEERGTCPAGLCNGGFGCQHA